MIESEKVLVDYKTTDEMPIKVVDATLMITDGRATIEFGGKTQEAKFAYTFVQWCSIEAV